MKNSKETSILHAFRLLQISFVVGLVLLGIDKLGGLNAIDWSVYLTESMKQHYGCDLTGLFTAVGIIEIVLGLGVIYKPRVFSPIIAGFFFLVMINFFATGMHYDHGLHTGMLGLAAVALMKLSLRKSDS